jgi:type IV fimbrial biogenesis protein FimT
MVHAKKKILNQQFLPRRKCQRGFTLPEVIIVIVIIAVLATIAIPGILHWLPNIRLKAAARDLYANMQEAKIQAIKRNQDWAIYFDTANNRYYICSDDGADDDWATLADNTIAKTVNLADYKSGVSYGSGAAPPPTGVVTYTNDVVVFNPRGTGNGGYVYLDHEKNRDCMRAGTLSSGAIRIHRWRGGAVWQ